MQLYTNLYKLGLERGTFIGEFTTRRRPSDHACALIKYRIVVGKGMEIPGEAIGVFHIENGQMVEYWLLERDQKMINDIVKISGKAEPRRGQQPADGPWGAQAAGAAGAHDPERHPGQARQHEEDALAVASQQFGELARNAPTAPRPAADHPAGART